MVESFAAAFLWLPVGTLPTVGYGAKCRCLLQCALLNKKSTDWLTPPDRKKPHVFINNGIAMTLGSGQPFCSWNRPFKYPLLCSASSNPYKPLNQRRAIQELFGQTTVLGTLQKERSVQASEFLKHASWCNTFWIFVTIYCHGRHPWRLHIHSFKQQNRTSSCSTAHPSITNFGLEWRAMATQRILGSL